MPMSPEADPSSIIASAYDQYADAIFRHCYFRLMNREVAKELMQEAFIKVFEYLKKGEKIDNIRAFLYKVANNLVVDFVRKKSEISLDELHESGFEPAGDTEETVLRSIGDERIFAALTSLKKEDRTLVILRFIDEWKPQEIADMLGMSANVVSVRLHRALKELKASLQSLS